MRLRAEIARLNVLVDLLEGQLAARKITPLEPPEAWGVGLNATQALLVGALAAVHPRVLTAEHLDTLLPRRDHAQERDVDGSARVMVHRVRKILGHDAIETIHGMGWRAGPQIAALKTAPGDRAGIS